jgi:hypothetical protein
MIFVGASNDGAPFILLDRGDGFGSLSAAPLRRRRRRCSSISGHDKVGVNCRTGRFLQRCYALGVPGGGPLDSSPFGSPGMEMPRPVACKDACSLMGRGNLSVLPATLWSSTGHRFKSCGFLPPGYVPSARFLTLNNGMAESVHCFMILLQTSHSAEPLSRAGDSEITS